METDLTIKYESSHVPATFRAWADKHADRIAAVDYDGGYSHPDTGRDCTAYNVLLRTGWCTEEDGLHTVIDPRVGEVKKAIREAQPCRCSECAEAHVQRGGRREGAGRKPLDPNGQTVVTTLRLTAAQRDTLSALGGAGWLRNQLDKQSRRLVK